MIGQLVKHWALIGCFTWLTIDTGLSEVRGSEVGGQYLAVDFNEKMAVLSRKIFENIKFSAQNGYFSLTFLAKQSPCL